MHPQRLLQQWETVRRSARRTVLDRIVYDVCDGAHSLGELDFGALCRRYGLPAPSRQTLTSGMVLRIPVLAFRLDEKSFMEQVVRAHVARA